MDAITDECLNEKVTLGEVKKEKGKILKQQATKEAKARSPTNVNALDGAVVITGDNDDEFAFGEVQEMSFGSGTIAPSFGATSKKQALVDIFLKYDRGNTGNMDPPTFKRMCMDMLTDAKSISEEDVRKFTKANDVSVVIAALDMDGDGAIQKDEFVSWILAGMDRPKARRQTFASKNQLNARLEMFLSAVEEKVNKKL